LFLQPGNANYLSMSELGTPENPEIIDPSLPPPRPSLNARWRVARQILLWLASISLPALTLDLICLWLIYTAMTYGGFMPWLALIVLALPALIFTLIAMVANIVLLPAFVYTLLGRMNQIQMNDPRLARFVRFKPFGD